MPNTTPKILWVLETSTEKVRKLKQEKWELREEIEPEKDIRLKYMA